MWEERRARAQSQWKFSTTKAERLSLGGTFPGVLQIRSKSPGRTVPGLLAEINDITWLEGDGEKITFYFPHPPC